ncbi:CASP-like protein 4A3 [Syzygium oleosum]|uniref:CASP-like protein 4A3 n=1 Tax=Syzygium oleosum TaxID=219896 RepID=UPI0024B88FEF|nr:CASP-like protein 4A3 [Syzygium oleosum]
MESNPNSSDPQNHHHHYRHHHLLLPRPQPRGGGAMKKSSSRNSESSTIHDSPSLYHSPLRSDEFGDPAESPPYSSPAGTLDKPPPPPPPPPPRANNSKAIVAVDKLPRCSPLHSRLPLAQKPLESSNRKPPPPPPLPRGTAVSRAAKEEDAAPEQPAAAAAKGGGRGGREEGRSAAVSTILRRSRSREMVQRAGLGFRMSEMILCLISFSVMAADKTQGWSGDSFDRYKEYRFCLSVNVIGFAYSGFQAYDLTYHFITGKHVIGHHLRCHFDFFMDQILAYLLIAASTAAATRVVDWETNWGKDQFTEMASASIGMAFLAFVSFAFSSLISGYDMCTRDFA